MRLRNLIADFPEVESVKNDEKHMVIWCQGLAILTVPLLAMTFGAKPSTGLMLPVLCFADVIGVSYYRRQAEWKYIIRLLPMAVAGFFLGTMG